jgi:2-methylcitrate dehydratase
MAGSPAKWNPTTHETADHSIPYATAVILRYGTIDDRYYDDRYLRDPDLLALVERVQCFPSDYADLREKDCHLCDLELVLKSGERRSVRVEHTRGHWQNPMSDAEMADKFRSLARRQLTAGQTEALLEQLGNLENLPHAAALPKMTRIEP